MKLVRYEEVESRPVREEGARDVAVRWLIGPEDGAPTFYMRRFELRAGGCTPRHAHAWEHEVYVLEGAGAVWHAGAERRLCAGDVVYMPPDEEHCFIAGQQGLSFLCLIPKEGQCGGSCGTKRQQAAALP